MKRRLDTQNSFLISEEGRRYLVTLQHLRNSECGTPRFKAYITDLTAAEDDNDGFAWSHVYNFSGHYRGEYWEANWILLEHLSKEC